MDYRIVKINIAIYEDYDVEILERLLWGLTAFKGIHAIEKVHQELLADIVRPEEPGDTISADDVFEDWRYQHKNDDRDE